MDVRVLLLIALTSNCLGCPKQWDPPCNCRLIGYHSSVITCENVDNEIILRKSVKSMKETTIPIKAVQIYETYVNYLPSDIFKGMGFSKLTIVASTMTSLSDTDIAFQGLEDSLEILELNNCDILGGFRWSQLRNLRALKELTIKNTDLDDIDKSVRDVAHIDIDLLQLTYDSISHVDDKAFAEFHNLKTISLKSNMISNVKRSMFPDPALQLQFILLSDNQLKYLPSDLFSNMPALKSIALSDNKLLTIEESTFSAIWIQLKYFDFLNNPLQCDCRLNWMLTLDFPLNTRVTCAEPQQLKRTEVKDLKGQKLWCL